MKAKPFYSGLFLLCMSTLLLQIVQTRILSVIAWYHLAFFSISMAMFGMTAGALWVYLRRDDGTPLGTTLAKAAAAYAVTIVICAGFEMASVVDTFMWATVFFVWANMILLLAPPFFLAGIVVSLALTRSPFPIARVYGVDLAGAASGCLVAIGLLNIVDGPSALIAIAAIGATAAACFATAQPPVPQQRPFKTMWAVCLAAGLAVLCIANASTIHGLRPIASKGAIERREYFAYEKWNSFSRVIALNAVTIAPFLWGASPTLPDDIKVEQHGLNIDGSAATTMSRFDGKDEELKFLDYDITNLAYSIRNRGKAAVIGVGGGRDVASAWHFGFRDITGVELNPIFIKLLTDPKLYRDFAGLASLPGVRFNVDDGRSWFARTRQHFDLVEMSLVDTWASTGAGGFTLSENGLYTAEGWERFVGALTPTGVFTVSRWYSSRDPNETGRAVSLAMAALFRLGVDNPRAHIYLASRRDLATIIVSRAPFTAADLSKLHAATTKYEYDELLSPDRPPTTPMYADLLGAHSEGDLVRRGSAYTLDVSPATDSRPFFFNMLRLDPGSILYALNHPVGVVRGNLIATGSVVLVIFLSTLLVLFTIVLPMRSSTRAVERRLVTTGTAYFLLIGVGFMLVEMGLIQRLSVFLGHPVYGLSIGLFSIILATGIGSFASEAIVLSNARRLAIWAGLLCVYLAVFPSWFPMLADHYESADILTRGTVAVLAIVPAGVLMGFGFPTGMRLVNAVDPRPTPWFWGVNGAAGVLASGIATGVSITTSIDVTLRLGALAYLAVGVAGMFLLARSEHRTEAEPLLREGAKA
jgi:hypothetical protein